MYMQNSIAKTCKEIRVKGMWEKKLQIKGDMGNLIRMEQRAEYKGRETDKYIERQTNIMRERLRFNNTQKAS